jgi:hypothetical protein
MYLLCNSRIHVITLYLGHVCVYYMSMLWCWHLVWILVRTDHPCLRVGCHSCSRPISKHYANRRTREACPIDCMETLDNIYGNGSRHVTQRAKLTETFNWESLFIPSWLSSCRSTNSPVGVNPHGSTEKVKLLLNDSDLEHQAVRPLCHRGDDDMG